MTWGEDRGGFASTDSSLSPSRRVKNNNDRTHINIVPPPNIHNKQGEEEEGRAGQGATTPRNGNINTT